MNHRNLLLAVTFFSSSFLLINQLNAQPTAGLVGHFKFDGNVTNIGSGSMTATPRNVTYTANGSGASNKAIQFGGSLTSDVIITDNGNLDFAADFSIAFGVNIATLASNQGFYDNGLNYGACGVWYFNSDNTLRFNFRNGSIGAPAALVVGQWKAVCVTRTGSTMRIYVNGTQVASGTEGTMGISYPNPPVLGQMYYAGTGGNYNPTSGSLDEFRFYNRALSAAEVAQLVPFSLPVKMGNFTASKQASSIQLNWETLSEQNTSHFQVERSADGTSFTAIGNVNARGNSTVKQSYNFTDAQPGAANNFYRLKLIDEDGKASYSRVIVIKNDNYLTVQLFPNPTTDVLQVQIPSQKKGTANLFIAEATGKILYRTTMQIVQGNNAASIPVKQYPAGRYYIIVEDDKGKSTNSFIKQ